MQVEGTRNSGARQSWWHRVKRPAEPPRPWNLGQGRQCVKGSRAPPLVAVTRRTRANARLFPAPAAPQRNQRDGRVMRGGNMEAAQSICYSQRLSLLKKCNKNKHAPKALSDIAPANVTVTRHAFSKTKKKSSGAEVCVLDVWN